MKYKWIKLNLMCIVCYWDIVYSQYIPTVEEGKEWTIKLDYGLGNYLFLKYTLWCDTLIEGNNYLGIYAGNNLYGFIREDTSLQIVYYRALDAESEEIILTYKGEVGDTMHLNIGDAVIREVYYDTLYGAVRKIIVSDNLITLVEGAGTTRYGIISDFWPPPPPPFLHDLQMSTGSCENITSTLHSTRSLSIYPNPFTDYINIATSENLPGYYEVYNSLGVKLLSGDFTDEITVDTKTLIPGKYLLMINRKIIKMIKQ